MGHRSLIQTFIASTLRFSEHRRELAREVCLRQLSDGDRLQWNMVRYSSVDTIQQIGV